MISKHEGNNEKPVVVVNERPKKKKKRNMTSVFRGITRDKRENLMASTTNPPPLGLYKLNFSQVQPQATTA